MIFLLLAALDWKRIAEFEPEELLLSVGDRTDVLELRHLCLCRDEHQRDDDHPKAGVSASVVLGIARGGHPSTIVTEMILDSGQRHIESVAGGLLVGSAGRELAANLSGVPRLTDEEDPLLEDRCCEWWRDRMEVYDTHVIRLERVAEVGTHPRNTSS